MPKMKTNKSASKRFKVTKTGKIKRHKAFASHLKTHKSAKRRRNLRKADIPSWSPKTWIASSGCSPMGN